MTAALIIIIVLLLVVLFILSTKLSKKEKLDIDTKNKNVELQKENQHLQEEYNQLVLDKEVIRNEISCNEQSRHMLNEQLTELQNNISNTIQQNEKVSSLALVQYIHTLEEAYNTVENEHDKKIAKLNQEYKQTQQDLDTIKATRAAAQEALLKEQEVKDNKDNYRLIPSDSDLADSRKLELVKRELNKPRILCMLIWQTYWQPLAKKQFPIILKTKDIMGIYKITNQMTNECYIGQAVDVYKRWCEHCKCGLGIDTPPGNKLYKAMQSYGLENFTFELIEQCSAATLNEKERYFINLYQSDIYGYNGNKGVTK